MGTSSEDTDDSVDPDDSVAETASSGRGTPEKKNWGGMQGFQMLSQDTLSKFNDVRWLGCFGSRSGRLAITSMICWQSSGREEEMPLEDCQRSFDQGHINHSSSVSSDVTSSSGAEEGELTMGDPNDWAPPLSKRGSPEKVFHAGWVRGPIIL